VTDESGWRDPRRVSAAKAGVAAARSSLHRSTLDRAGFDVDGQPAWRASCACGKSHTGTFELAEKWATRHPEEQQ
jgi:hypothetical protein